MNTEIIKFLSKYISLTKEEIQIISDLNLIKSFKKGAILLSEGKIAHHCYFIMKGCVSSYYLVNGEVKITAFYTENHPITPVGYTNKKPSEYFLECTEDCIISIGTPQNSAELIKKVPKIATLSTIVLGEQLANQQIKYDDLIKLPPEKRYLNLQNSSPDLINRVPQYMIASYLGIKPESLSRIRKRLN